MFFVAFQSSVSCYNNRKQNIEELACHKYVAQSEFLLIFHPDPEGQLLVPQRNHILGLVPSYDLGCSPPQALAVLGKRGVIWSTPDSKEQVQARVQPQCSGKILGSGSYNRLGLALCANTPVKETCWEQDRKRGPS